MTTNIKLRRSAVQGKIPTTLQLDLGEVAINTYDGVIYLKKDDGAESIVSIQEVTKSLIDGLNVTAADVQANSVALGADTTGDYVASISGTANEIEVSGTGEGASVTVGLPDDIDIAGSISVTSLFDLIGETGSTSSVTQTEIASFTAATYSSGKFIIQATDNVTGEVHVTEMLVVHDGTTAGATEYGTIHTGASPLATYDVDINTGNVRILATAASTDSTTYKITENLITT